MRNNDERKAFVRNELNWKPIELTTFTATKLLRYKGDEWLKVCVITEREKWWDEDLHTHNRRIVKELDDKGLYTVNADGDALCYTNETEIVNRMKELDKMYPDRAGKPAIPPIITVTRSRLPAEPVKAEIGGKE